LQGKLGRAPEIKTKASSWGQRELGRARERNKGWGGQKPLRVSRTVNKRGGLEYCKGKGEVGAQRLRCLRKFETGLRQGNKKKKVKDFPSGQGENSEEAKPSLYEYIEEDEIKLADVRNRSKKEVPGSNAKKRLDS